MSRSGYCDDCDDQWGLIRYRGAVKSAIQGRRGQAFLKEMLAALDALPDKKLITHELVRGGEVCAIGAVAKSRALDVTNIDPEESEQVASAFAITESLAREIVYMNDEGHYTTETPEQRYVRMRSWVEDQIRKSV